MIWRNKKKYRKNGWHALKRFLHILSTMRHYGLFSFMAPLYTHWIIRLFAWSEAKRPPQTCPDLAGFCSQLGPLFIKAGQLLSLRCDLFSAEIIHALSRLQDRIPPLPFTTITPLLEAHYGSALHDHFAEIIPEPLGSASIAQVHAARLWNGEEVVLKIRRPELEEELQADFSLLKKIGGWLQKKHPFLSDFPILALIQEIQDTLYQECDFSREAAQASAFRRQWKQDSLLVVPKIYWALSSDTILVQERMYGLSLEQLKKTTLHTETTRKVAENIIRLFFTQVFVHRFFHADLHPGNLLIDLKNPMVPKTILIDFGMMGQLNEHDHYYLFENFLSLFQQDYARVALLHQQAGWIPASVNLLHFESTLRTVSEPLFDQRLSDISFAQVLVRLFQTAHQFHMRLQPQFLLLQKTLLTIEGVSRSLYPELDFYGTIAPVLRKIARQRYYPRNMIASVQSRLPQWIKILRDSALESDRHKENRPDFSAPLLSPFLSSAIISVLLLSLSTSLVILWMLFSKH